MKTGKWTFAHGDRVRFRCRRFNGATRVGKVNGLLVFPGHCVLDMGGGRPQVVQADDIVAVIPRPPVAPTNGSDRN